MRLILGSGVVCIASWLALAVGAGGDGLQRSISKGATSLFIEQSVAVALVAVTAFAIALLVTRVLGLRPMAVVVGVFVGDVLAGLVLAPLAVGELEPIHAPLVVAAVSVLGVQPLAALAGALLAARAPRSTHLGRGRR